MVDSFSGVAVEEDAVAVDVAIVDVIVENEVEEGSLVVVFVLPSFVALPSLVVFVSPSTKENIFKTMQLKKTLKFHLRQEHRFR